MELGCGWPLPEASRPELRFEEAEPFEPDLVPEFLDPEFLVPVLLRELVFADEPPFEPDPLFVPERLDAPDFGLRVEF